MLPALSAIAAACAVTAQPGHAHVPEQRHFRRHRQHALGKGRPEVGSIVRDHDLGPGDHASP